MLAVFYVLFYKWHLQLHQNQRDSCKLFAISKAFENTLECVEPV